LRSAGLRFRVVPSPHEEKPLPGEGAAAYARRAARGKAEAALTLLGVKERRAALLAADTIVVLDGRILGKPSCGAEALNMLRALAGRVHTVVTACCLYPWVGGPSAPLEFALQSRVSLWDAPPELLAAYAAGPEPLDKAGGYAAQGAGAMLTRSVEGSWSNVVGLPVSETVEQLLACGGSALRGAEAKGAAVVSARVRQGGP
jgi:septum formation protein